MPWLDDAGVGYIEMGGGLTVDPTCGPTWATWRPPALTANNVPPPVDMTIKSGFVSSSLDQATEQWTNLKPQMLWEACPNYWETLDLDWGPVDAVAADMKTVARAGVSGLGDHRGFSLQVTVSNGGLLVQVKAQYSVGAIFSPGPGDLYSDSWRVDFDLLIAGETIINETRNESASAVGGSVGVVNSPYPGFSLPSSLWLHYTPTTLTSSHGTAGLGALLSSGGAGITGTVIVDGLRDSHASDVSSLIGLRGFDVVVSAGVYTDDGSVFPTLGSLYPP